ncbi:MAG: hypothetical protein WC655_08555 [Candidatus Hydrogenedentales bacterium]|jgi:hypothetical protein
MVTVPGRSKDAYIVACDEAACAELPRIRGVRPESGTFQQKSGVMKSCGQAKSRLEASVTTHNINRYDPLSAFRNNP